MMENEAMKRGQCNEMLTELSAYIDGELDASDSHRVELHLEKCEKCRETHRALSLLSQDIGAASVPYPSDLHSHIMASLGEEMEKGRKKNRAASFGNAMKKHGMWIGVGVAAVICLVLVGSPVFRGDLAFGMDAAKSFEAEEDAMMPQNGGIEVASDMSKSNTAGRVYCSADDAELFEAETKYCSSYSLADGMELPAEEEQATVGKTDYAVVPESAAESESETERADSHKIEYDLMPSFMLPRGVLDPKKTELYH